MQHSRLCLLSPFRLSTVILSILFISSLSFAAVPDRISSVIDTRQKVVLGKSLHPRALPQFDQGPVDPSQKLTYISLVLSPSVSQQRALNQLQAQQQDPKAANYHKWLTPQQYADRFGLSQNDIGKIAAWLKSEGFEVVSVGGGRNQVVFTGTVAQAQNAFRTEIHTYKIKDEEHFANSTPLMIPSALQGVVTGVLGLHSFLPKPASVHRGARATGNARPAYYDAYFLFPNFIAPDDVATIYDIAPLYNASTEIDGTGQTLGIIGQTDVYLDDLNNFRTGFGLPGTPINCTTNSSGIITACDDPHFEYQFVGGNNLLTDPGVASPCGDLGEADLDLEWSGAIARNAKIIYFNAPVTYSSDCSSVTSGGGVYAALTAAIGPPNLPLTKVISMSYGYCEIGAPDLETYLQQANTEGITILNASGDVSSAACDYSPPTNNPPFGGAVYGPAVSYPASSQYVTGVGGTEISLANDSYPSQSSYWLTSQGTNGGTAVSYIPEISWNEVEEFANYCHAPPAHDTFCSTGGGTQGWVPLSTSATAQQVQSDIWIEGGGGGASNCWYLNSSGACLGAGAGPTSGGGFPQPAYQQGLSVPSAPAGVRYVPDVSLMASPDFPGYIFCTQLSELGDSGSGSSCSPGGSAGISSDLGLNDIGVVGGTSVSSPVFAGIVALWNQYVVANGIQTTPGLGNINPTLYRLAAQDPTAFHSVLTGDNMVYCQANTPAGQPSNIVCPSSGVFGYKASNADSATGYNLVTGLGSVDANNLMLALTAPSFVLSVSGSTSTITTTPGGTAGPATITVTGSVTGGQTSAALTYSCSGLPSGAGCVFSPAGATTAATVTVSISTTGPSSQMREPLHRGNHLFYAMTLPGLFGIVFSLTSRKRASRSLRLFTLFLLLSLVAVGLVACGGGSNGGGGGGGGGGTPQGTYPILVTATSGTVHATPATLTLTVN